MSNSLPDPFREDPSFSCDIEAEEFWKERDQRGVEDQILGGNVHNSRQGRRGSTDFCKCGNCGAMPTDEESFCCQEMRASNVKMNEGNYYLFIQFWYMLQGSHGLWPLGNILPRANFDTDTKKTIKYGKQGKQ